VVCIIEQRKKTKKKKLYFILTVTPFSLNFDFFFNFTNNLKKTNKKKKTEQLFEIILLHKMLFPQRALIPSIREFSNPSCNEDSDSYFCTNETAKVPSQHSSSRN